mgnify:CR=1 FL=1
MWKNSGFFQELAHLFSCNKVSIFRIVRNNVYSVVYNPWKCYQITNFYSAFSRCYAGLVEYFSQLDAAFDLSNSFKLAARLTQQGLD